jgi:uncharacterized circularly permuted ATP-grasp superfamily protein
MTLEWTDYPQSNFYDELIDGNGLARPGSKRLLNYLSSLSKAELESRQKASELAMMTMGVTFTVYDGESNIERSWPFDIIPRIIRLHEWQTIEAGLIQRVQALNFFIADLYGDQKIIKDKVFPGELLQDSVNYCHQCAGVTPPYNVWAHICGSDLVRNNDGTMYVLEDNLRIPSGVSYMLENRLVSKRVFPELFTDYHINPVDDYAYQLYDMLSSLSPQQDKDPVIVVLTPGRYNSAYFEHSYLAQHMGVYLVEGSDLFVSDEDKLYMKTINGPIRVDVVYRRIDDQFLDPEVFKKDSMLGVPGIMRAWKSGQVALANAPGAGVADDKVVYAFVPDMIRYYLDAEPLISNVPTYLCMREKDRRYVLDNLDKLVVKPANESGGYGMLIGPHASDEQRQEFAENINKNPRNYIAQPTLNISTSPTLSEQSIVPRHIDLRPFILSGEKNYVTHGGLTRVALKAGSLVVNSSQGGGSKDTWIVS